MNRPIVHTDIRKRDNVCVGAIPECNVHIHSLVSVHTSSGTEDFNDDYGFVLKKQLGLIPKGFPRMSKSNRPIFIVLLWHLDTFISLTGHHKLAGSRHAKLSLAAARVRVFSRRIRMMPQPFQTILETTKTSTTSP